MNEEEKDFNATVDIKNLTKADKKEQERLKKSRNPDGTFNEKRYEELIKERLDKKSENKNHMAEEIEVHPYPPFIPEGVEYLIIGTFPPVEGRRTLKFYYPNPENDFWKILSAIYQVQLRTDASDEAVEERKALMRSKKMGITDVFEKIIRLNPKSSSDQDLYSEVEDGKRNIIEILKNHPSILTLFFTSGKGKNGAEGVFTKMINEVRINVKGKLKQTWMTTPNKNEPKERSFKLDGREIKTVTLYSPSRTAQRWGTTVNQKIEQYKKYLPK